MNPFRRALVLLLLLFAPASAWATKDIHFFTLEVQPDGENMVVRAAPEPLIAFNLLKDDNYAINQNDFTAVLDNPLRQTAFLLRTLERNRGTIYDGKSDYLPVISYRFELAVRDVRGEIISDKNYKVILGLNKTAGEGVIVCDCLEEPITFPINQLSNPTTYREFLINTVMPFGKAGFPMPSQEEFLVDLYFRWPQVEVAKKDFNVFDLFPSLILWDRDLITKIKINLGSTYVHQKDNLINQTQDYQLKVYQQAIALYGKALEDLKKGASEAVPTLEDYVSVIPDDKKALKRLMESYLAVGMDDEAFSLISRFQPMFATIREGLSNQRDLAGKAESRRNRLMGRLGRFARNKQVKLKITSPEPNDLVTGTTDLTFSLAGNEAPVLVIECYLEEQRIARLTKPPYKVPFTVDGNFGKLSLRVSAYFEDETFSEDEIVVDTLRVDEEERVQLVPLHASVFNLRANGERELTKEDFVLKENKKVKEIAHFRKDTAPLRIAIILDTSISMFGDKLYRAMYAVKTFLSKLSPEDAVAIYTFDSKVLKMTDFTNEFDELVPRVMTLSPLGATRLYDAMLVANDALVGQNGTKVMIVVSDGDDSDSATTDIHVAGALRNSPVMVYPIILPGGVFPEPQEAAMFLESMARLTGSIYTRVRRVDNLDEKFDRIYQDFKSFYYIDYYSTEFNPNKRDLRLNLKKGGTRVRFRTLN
ncbi:VWA domain-containing protein [Acanthopleuribacter pedis]|uniref:VWA domain-containing protein n=1 Tax=Acanthopleuribacter pedis TaxID=442870 RepID=A0A8J7U5K7_9BACT|nr:VWA domain-containing protein [Acanthopleuribacter pedis]MBO1320954.1 VWA domain-containing protein [Acanthopleuribacter pedis]